MTLQYNTYNTPANKIPVTNASGEDGAEVTLADAQTQSWWKTASWAAGSSWSNSSVWTLSNGSLPKLTGVGGQ